MSKNDTIKNAMIQALEKSLGVVTTACRSIDISRETHYRWMREDENYKESVNELENVSLDFVESKIHKLIEKGDTAATIFYLKTIGKSRGYLERLDVTSDGKQINAPTIIVKDVE